MEVISLTYFGSVPCSEVQICMLSEMTDCDLLV